MSLEALVLVFAGAFAGSFANGLTGFGTGFTVMGFWLSAVPPTVAAQLVGLVLVMLMLSGVALRLTLN